MPNSSVENLPNEDPAPSVNAQRVVEILLADQVRTNGEIKHSRVDSLMEKRDLPPDERVWVYRKLNINSNDEIDELKVDGLEEELTELKTTKMPDVVKSFMNKTKKIPLLDFDEERVLGRLIQNGELLKRALEEGRIQSDEVVRSAIERADTAKNKMILGNIRLVVSNANKFDKVCDLEVSDLVQEGMFGLIRAVEKFDPTLGLKFSTYAVWWIRQSIYRAMSDKGKTIRFPVHMVDSINKLRKVNRKLIEENGGRSVSIEVLADKLGWDVKHTVACLAYSQMTMLSIDLPDDSADGKSPLRLTDQTRTPDLIAEQNELELIIDNTLGLLSKREAEVIKRRFGLSNSFGREETLEQIAHDFGVTRERIRQIEVKALKKLSHPKKKKAFEDYDE